MDIKSVQRCLLTGEMAEIPISSHSEPGVVYYVLIQDPDDEVDEAVCDCEGFRFRGTCRHQQEAHDALCQWHELVGPEVQTESQRRNKLCPRCLGPTEWTMEAVDDDET